MKVLEWTIDKWLMQGLLTSILTGVGFVVISFTIEYIKRFRKGRQVKEQEILLQRLLCGEQVLDLSNGTACARDKKECLLGTGRSMPKGHILFEQYKRAGGFLGVGQGYYSRLNEARRKLAENLQDKSMVAVVSKVSWCGGPASNAKDGASSTSVDDEITSLEWDTGRSGAPTLRDYLSPNNASVKSDPVAKEYSGSNSNNAVVKQEIRLWSKQTNRKSQKKESELDLGADMFARALKEHPHLAPYLRQDVLEAAQNVEREKAKSDKREKKIFNRSKGKAAKRSSEWPSRKAFKKFKENKLKRDSPNKEPKYRDIRDRSRESQKDKGSPFMVENELKVDAHEVSPTKEKTNKKVKNKTKQQHGEEALELKLNLEGRHTFRRAILRREASTLKGRKKIKRQRSNGLKSTRSDISARRAPSQVKQATSCASIRSLPSFLIGKIQSSPGAFSTNVGIPLSKGKELPVTEVISKKCKSKKEKSKSKAKIVKSPLSKKPGGNQQTSDDEVDTLKRPCETNTSMAFVTHEVMYGFEVKQEDIESYKIEESHISHEENVDISFLSPRYLEPISPNQEAKTSRCEEDENKDVVSSSISGYIRSLVFGDHPTQSGDSDILGEGQVASPKNFFFMSNSPMTTIQEATCGSWVKSSSSNTCKNIDDVDTTQDSNITLLATQVNVDVERCSRNTEDTASVKTEQSTCDFFSCSNDEDDKGAAKFKRSSNRKRKVLGNASSDIKRKGESDKTNTPFKSKRKGRDKKNGRSSSFDSAASGERKARSLKPLNLLPSTTSTHRNTSKLGNNPEKLESDTSSSPVVSSTPRVTARKTSSKKLMVRRLSSCESNFSTKPSHQEKDLNIGSSKKRAGRSVDNALKEKRSASENFKKLEHQENVGGKKKAALGSTASVNDTSGLQNTKVVIHGKRSTAQKKVNDAQKSGDIIPTENLTVNQTLLANQRNGKEVQNETRQPKTGKATKDSLRPGFSSEGAKNTEKEEVVGSRFYQPHSSNSEAKEVRRASKKMKERQKCRHAASTMLDNYNIEIKREEVLGSVVSLVTYHRKNTSISNKGFKNMNCSIVDQSKNCRDEIKRVDSIDDPGIGDQPYLGSTQVEDFESYQSVLQSPSYNNSLPCPSIEFDTDSESELTYTSKYGRFSLRLHDPDVPQKKTDIPEQTSSPATRTFSLRPSALDDVVKDLESQGKRRCSEEQIGYHGIPENRNHPSSPPEWKGLKMTTASPTNPSGTQPIDSGAIGFKTDATLDSAEFQNGCDKQHFLITESQKSQIEWSSFQHELALQTKPQPPVLFPSSSYQKDYESNSSISFKTGLLDGANNDSAIFLQTESSDKEMVDAKEHHSPQQTDELSFLSMKPNVSSEKALADGDDTQCLESLQENTDHQIVEPCYQSSAPKVQSGSPTRAKHGLNNGKVSTSPSALNILEARAKLNSEIDNDSKCKQKKGVMSSKLGSKGIVVEKSKTETPIQTKMLANRNKSPGKVHRQELDMDIGKKERVEVKNTFLHQVTSTSNKTDSKKKATEPKERKSPQKMQKPSSSNEERHGEKRIPSTAHSPNKNKLWNSVKKPAFGKNSPGNAETVTNLKELSKQATAKPYVHQRLCINRTSPVKIPDLVGRKNQRHVAAKTTLGKPLSHSESSTAEPLEESSGASYTKATTLTSTELVVEPQERELYQKTNDSISQHRSNQITCENPRVGPEAAKLIKALGGVPATFNTKNEISSENCPTGHSFSHPPSSGVREKDPHVFGSNANFSVDSFRIACPSPVVVSVEPGVKVSNYRLTGDHFRTYRQRKDSDDEY